MRDILQTPGWFKSDDTRLSVLGPFKITREVAVCLFYVQQRILDGQRRCSAGFLANTGRTFSLLSSAGRRLRAASMGNGTPPTLGPELSTATRTTSALATRHGGGQRDNPETKGRIRTVAAEKKIRLTRGVCSFLCLCLCLWMG